MRDLSSRKVEVLIPGNETHVRTNFLLVTTSNLPIKVKKRDINYVSLLTDNVKCQLVDDAEFVIYRTSFIARMKMREIKPSNLVSSEQIVPCQSVPNKIHQKTAWQCMNYKFKQDYRTTYSTNT
jgi:hypothetical protein